MRCTDVIADMLTRIRNASASRHKFVDIPASGSKIAIAQILADEGYIKKFEVIKDDKQNILRLWLKYVNKVSAISRLQRVSKPGYRRYVKCDEIVAIPGVYGISIVSTSKGIMTGKNAKRLRLGGELMALIW